MARLFQIVPITISWLVLTVCGRLLPYQRFLHESGWGLMHGYPAFILDKRDSTVQGFVFTSDELFEHWWRLDDFERVASVSA